MTCVVTKLHTSVKDFSARGGASILEVGGKIIVFGGADREQTHFQDMMVYGGDAGSNFRTVKCTGDVPMPRSGHAVVAYGRFMFLFGGIDFGEEAVFNDLYILDTDTFEWGYVGESGEEVVARNSHSLGIVAVDGANYLIIYGGASPEHGPLGDTLYAKLPAVSDIDKESVFVKWTTLQSTVASTPSAAPPASAEATTTVFTAVAASAAAPQQPRPQPGSREMHGTCCCNGVMVITGGRNGNGEILSDAWILGAVTAAVDAESGKAPAEEDAPPRLEWRRSTALQLPMARCAHGAAAVLSGTPAALTWSIILFGGFTTGGISEDVIRAQLPGPDDIADASGRWSKQELSSSITGRFGVAACGISLRVLNHVSGNKKYAPVFSARAKEAVAQVQARAGEAAGEAGVAVVLFGGVCIEQDFGDLHLLLV